MALSLSTLRKQVASKVEGVGLKLSRQTPDFFGRTQNTIAHKAFSVGLGTSTAMDERQRRAVGIYIQTPLQVTFSYRLRPTDIYPTDYDLAMDTEESVINAVLEAYTGSNQFTIRYTGSTRQVTESQEYIIIIIEFIALHTI
jgi:hypothetical protein